MMVHKTIKTISLLTVLLLGLSACGLRPSTTAVPPITEGSLKPIPGAEGEKLVVTSKSFTEQLILGKIAVLIAQSAGFDVVDMTNVPGSQPARKLMISGQADVFFEYTGTAWLTYLGHETGIPDQQQQWQAVHDEDAANGLTWGKPARLNNTYAFAVRADYAQQHGITTLSDMAKVPVAERTLCVESEFNSRSDGLNPMLVAYGLPRGEGVPEANISLMDTGTVYQATADGACNFGEVFTTDGRIQSLNLVVLEDDKHFFPAYNAAPVFGAELLKTYPELGERFSQVTALLDDDTMRSLNLKVDVQGAEPAQVAYDWMRDNGFIG